VFFPVGRNFVINLAGLLVEDGGRIAIGSRGGVNGLPDIELLAGARVRAQGEFILIYGFDGNEGLA
jgi:hypothetical protein